MALGEDEERNRKGFANLAIIAQGIMTTQQQFVVFGMIKYQIWENDEIKLRPFLKMLKQRHYTCTPQVSLE